MYGVYGAALTPIEIIIWDSSLFALNVNKMQTNKNKQKKMSDSALYSKDEHLSSPIDIIYLSVFASCPNKIYIMFFARCRFLIYMPILLLLFVVVVVLVTCIDVHTILPDRFFSFDIS